MLIAKVIGTVVSTRKNRNLIGSKFMLVETLPVMKEEPRRLVAVDQAGAGISDLVLVSVGSAARIENGAEYASIDAAIVGVIDSPDEIVIKE